MNDMPRISRNFDPSRSLRTFISPRISISLLLLAAFAFTGCSPVFSDLQSAKLVGKDNVEFTPSVSKVDLVNEGESDEFQTSAGIQAGLGMSDNADFRVRIERISIDSGSGSSTSYNVFGLGPKIGIEKDRSALYLPVGFAFGDEIVDMSTTWEFHPTLLFTIPIGTNTEFNPSAKALIPLNREGADVLLAFNLGFGLSSDIEQWAIRPEIGFLFNPDAGFDSYWMHFSLGLTLFP